MAITFRSSIQEMVQIKIRDADGSTRVAVLQRDPNNSRKWSGAVEHPSGERWAINTFDPDEFSALGNLSQALVSRQSDYREAKIRGHRRALPTIDRNVPVDDAGSETFIINEHNRR
jgi:hypothetical protein